LVPEGEIQEPRYKHFLDVLVHTVGVRAAKVRLAKLKESENDAVERAYSDNFLDPFDYDESPQDKTTREEEEKEEAELDEAEEDIWSSCSVWGGVVRRVSSG